MKPFYTVILSLFTLFILSTQVKANRVIVKGNIKYANGSPAVNQKVKIAIEVSSANNCNQTREVSTNSTGHYEGVLECISNILKVKTSTADCKGFPVVHQGIKVPASGTVEDNFTIAILPRLLIVKLYFLLNKSPALFQSDSTVHCLMAFQQAIILLKEDGSLEMEKF